MIFLPTMAECEVDGEGEGEGDGEGEPSLSQQLSEQFDEVSIS